MLEFEMAKCTDEHRHVVHISKRSRLLRLLPFRQVAISNWLQMVIMCAHISIIYSFIIRILMAVMAVGVAGWQN